MKQTKSILALSLTLFLIHCDTSTDLPTIGGKVSGLDGTVVLQNNGRDDLRIKKNGSFTFSESVLLGASYMVAIKTQPKGQACVVSNEEGSAVKNVANVKVTCADKVSDNEAADPTTITASVDHLALSVADTATDAALTGNPRTVVVTNTGLVSTQILQVFPLTTLPHGTSITSNTCNIPLAPGASCSFDITPGATPTAMVGVESPDPIPMAIEADNTNTLGLNVHVLTYGSVYQGGYLYSMDDTTPNTGSIGGKVVSLVDQAEGEQIAGPQTSSLIWSSNGNGSAETDVITDVILGVDETSTVLSPSPTTPTYPVGTPAYTSCAGTTNGSCNTANIVNYYNFNRTVGGAAPTPLNFYAAGLCKPTIGGFSDWYLPSICETVANGACPSSQNMAGTLPFLLGNINAGVPTTSCTLGTNCIVGRYWTSTESSASPADTAWSVLLRDMASSGNEVFKDRELGVRCSRAITL